MTHSCSPTPLFLLLSRADAALLGRVALTKPTAPLARLVFTFSQSGNYGFSWLIGGAYAGLVSRSFSPVWRSGLAVGAGLLVNTLIKRRMDRHRPQSAFHLPPSSSFPSAHATISAASATLLSKRWPGARLPLGLLAAAYAASRLALAAHYPSDVAGGMALGHLLGRGLYRGERLFS